MSDPGFQRRQPPSPLVFTQESGSPATQHPAHLNSGPPTSSHGSGSNTVSMPFVRRHVTRRLKAAKMECDKELQRVTNNITAFFEERLREGDHETERELRERERDRSYSGGDSSQGDSEPLREGFILHPFDLRSALQTDESSSDGGYDAEPETYRRSRARASLPGVPTLTHSASSPTVLTASTSASSLSPASMRRQNTVPWERPLTSSTSSSVVSSSPVTSTMALPENARKQGSGSGLSSSRSSQGLVSRRLSRTIHIARPVPQSGQSSRSTSRSRSPLPPATTRTSFSESFGPVINHRSSRILVDDPIDPIMSALYDIIGVATDIVDMTIAQLTAQSKVCESLVQRIQNIGKAWDEHPDWHGRNWYVQVLLAVASLSRVVEWWEAEKQFWNFDDNEDEQDEPLMFVTKPADEASPVTAQVDKLSEATGNLKLTTDNESKLALSRPPSQVKRSRDEPPKDGSLSPLPLDQRTPSSEIPGSHASTESATVLATERLRLQAETAQNQNIVIELSLDGDHFIWINYAWRVVLGTDPEQLAGTRISRLLSSDDWGVFKKATQQLLEDDSHTVEVRFKLQKESQDGSGCQYQTMEGKGMVMIDREDGQPSHTMWVVKPTSVVSDPEGPTEGEGAGDVSTSESGEKGVLERRASEGFPFESPLSIDPILCRICECQIPQWYFEKHSETCVETHRLEAEIAECNESIQELRNTIRDLIAAVDKTSSPVIIPEYRGVPLYSPASSPVIPSPLQLFTRNKMKRLSMKKMQKRLLEQLEDILAVAAEVSMPSLKEEEAKEPIERQRLLSPGSERKMSQIRNWSKPTIEDGALGQLVEDTWRVMRQKIDNVVRMQNTIRYSEKIWHEWQEKVEGFLATVDEAGSSDEEEAQQGDGDGDGDRSSATSEYAFGSRSGDPTPMASLSAIPPATSEPRFGFPIPSAAPIYAPQARHQVLQTRSSTPSSVSSPLALAEPIIASQEDTLPHMDLDEPSTSLTIRTRASAQNLAEVSDPRLLATPPVSPNALTRETSFRSGRGHRRHSTANQIGAVPLSPRQSSVAPLSRTSPTSIKDFDIIKPISKGAFGSVFLAKKKATGDYFAIKVLKKADMISKNQITNVKAERMILMKQADSPFVAKLYFTFQSKENLYLVMEYLNGGDCAALIKTIGSLPEEWTKNYVAEVVLGLEYLHQRGIVHRDLKPDNLLIDQHGHLKLTDFGLSRIGLLGRQTREGQTGRLLGRHNSRSRPPSIDSGYLSSPLIHGSDLNLGGSYFNQRTQTVPRFGNSPYFPSTDDVSESSGSESHYGVGVGVRRNLKHANESPLQSFATELTNDLRSHSTAGSGATPSGEQKFVGTPDYLAPETILGLRGDDASVDWWALGVITYEFLYGIPPFHAETPEKVFENILSRQIDWHEDWVEYSDKARDFMQRLMTLDASDRLGANGAAEVKSHPFFDGIDWDKIMTTEAAFIPQVDDPESTDYFDPRGASFQVFHDDEPIAIQPQSNSDSPSNATAPPMTLPLPIKEHEMANTPGDDFGSFSFKNLPVLKLANDEMIRKIKTDQMAPLTHTLSEPSDVQIRRRSISQRLRKPPSVVTNMNAKVISAGPPSPATSTSSIASSPSRGSLPPPTPGSSGHVRKPSEYGAVERFKLNHLDGDRRNSMPSRLRTASVSSVGDASGSENWNSSLGYGSTQPECSTPPSSIHSIDLRKGPDPSDRAVTCLLAEDNPITAKIIETLLVRLGCRCVVVADGSEAISVAMGDIKFDCILMDLHMPVLDGEGAARYIKSTNGKNTNTPIVAISAYSGNDPAETSNVFSASLSKPLQKADLLSCMRQLGFKTSTVNSGPGSKVTASVTAPLSMNS